MRNYQASKRLIVQKLAKTDDILTIYLQNIIAILEKTTTFNTTCTTWNIIINSINLFQGLSQGLQFKGSYLGSSVIGFSLGFSVIDSL